MRGTSHMEILLHTHTHMYMCTHLCVCLLTYICTCEGRNRNECMHAKINLYDYITFLLFFSKNDKSKACQEGEKADQVPRIPTGNIPRRKNVKAKSLGPRQRLV